MTIRDAVRAYEPRLGWEQRRGARWVFDPTVRRQWGFSLGEAARYVTSKRTMLFGPKYMMPWYNHSIGKVLVRLGIRPVFETGRQDPCAVMVWHYETRIGPEVYGPLVERWGRVINARCVDVGKDNVERIHRRVFGYGLEIDPRQADGRYIRKGIAQSTKDGVVLHEPVEPEPGFVYQRLVQCEVHRGLYEDIRIVVVGGVAPICMVRLRPEDRRFGGMPAPSDLIGREMPFALAYVVPVAFLLDRKEVALVETFADAAGLDFGEIDVLRDRTDGRLYAVDVNNVVHGPTVVLSPRDIRKLLNCYCEATEELLPQFAPSRA